MTLDKLVLEFKKTKLEEILAQLTEEQRSKFYRIYPGVIPEKSLSSAYDLCERTIRKNQSIVP
jgi:hypothetical protein